MKPIRTAQRAERPLRVLHVINGLARGGAETVLFRLATHTSGIEHEVICLEGPDWYSDELEKHGIRVHHLNWKSPSSGLRAISKLRQLIRTSNADVVQAWMYRSNVLAGLFSRMAGKPVLWNIRCSSLGPLRFVSRAAARIGGLLAGSHADFIVNCSAKSIELHERLGYGRADGAVIPNGYDPAEFAPNEQARLRARKSLGVSADEFVVGCIARWHAQKGFPVLFTALRRLKDRGLSFRFLLTGRGLGRDNAELVSWINDSGCSGIVEALGETSDVAGIARALDVHVLASIGSEGFPNTVAETMLSATPNIVTDVGDAALIVGNTGWVVEPNDVEKLTEALEKAYHEWRSSPERWQQRRSASRQRVAEEFPLTRMVSSYEELWRRFGKRSLAAESAEPAVPAAAASKPLRVLHVISGLGPGGAETLLYRLATGPFNVHHEVISLGLRDWYSASFEESGITVHHVNVSSFGSALLQALPLFRLVRKSRADVVQCWMYRANLLGGLAARAAGIPALWGIHGSTLEGLRPGSRFIARVGGALARWVPDAVLNCAERSAVIHAELGYDAAEVVVIQNGYDPDLFQPDDSKRQETRAALELDRSRMIAGCIARWHPQKGIPVLLEAAGILRGRGVPIELLLVGRGLTSSNPELARLVSDCGCEDSVHLMGERGDIADVARVFDVHVLASVSEAFPNVVAETMLSGVPNVATDVGDVRIMVGDTGWIVPPKNPERLADAIEDACRELFSEPNRWKERRQAARAHIAERFTFERMAQRYQQIWTKVAARAAN